ncbi:MAG: hypothetical protein ABIR57_11345 [Aeromicrobium sp.]
MRRMIILAAVSAVAFVAVPMPSAIAAPATVSLATSANSIKLGETFVLSGAVSPGGRGKTVSVERRFPGKSWAKIVSKKFSKSKKVKTSTYSFVIEPAKAGPREYRIRRSGKTPAYSKAQNVDVYRWQYLADLPHTTKHAARTRLGAFTIHDSVYPRSISISPVGFTEMMAPPAELAWDLSGRRCTQLDAYLGLSKDSPRSSSTLIRFYDKSAKKNLIRPIRVKQKNDASRWDVALTKPKLSFAFLVDPMAFDAIEAPRYQAVIGTPRVYCNS